MTNEELLREYLMSGFGLEQTWLTQSLSVLIWPVVTLWVFALVWAIISGVSGQKNHKNILWMAFVATALTVGASLFIQYVFALPVEFLQSGAPYFVARSVVIPAGIGMALMAFSTEMFLGLLTHFQVLFYVSAVEWFLKWDPAGQKMTMLEKAQYFYEDWAYIYSEPVIWITVAALIAMALASIAYIAGFELDFLNSAKGSLAFQAASATAFIWLWVKVSQVPILLTGFGYSWFIESFVHGGFTIAVALAAIALVITFLKGLFFKQWWLNIVPLTTLAVYAVYWLSLSP